MSPLAVVFHLHRGYPVWAFFAMLAVCGGLVVYFYLNNARSLPRWYFNLLFGLRILIVVVLLLFIFQPRLVFSRWLARKPTMVVLLDASQSMSHADDPQTGRRFDLARTNLQGSRFLDTLEDQFRVELFAFAAAPERVAEDELEELEADGERTDLWTACDASLRTAKERGTVAGIVVLTDGVDNSTHAPLEQLPDLGLPVHTVGFGLRFEEQKDVRNIEVRHVEHDHFVPKDNATEIKVTLLAQGYPRQAVRVVFRDEKKGEELAAQRVTLPAGDEPTELTLEFTPREVRRIDGAVVVPHLDDEAIRNDNARPVTINVTKPRIKVLYIEGLPRQEGKWLLRTLEQDPNVDVLYLVKTRAGRFLQVGSIKGITLDGIPDKLQVWKRFDVIILGDLDSNHFPRPQQLVDLKEAVLEGRGLLLMGGQSALGPGGYGKSLGGETGPVELLSPVELGPRTIGQVDEPFMWRLTDDGQVHPIFSAIVRFFPTRDGPAEVPLQQKLAGCTGVGPPKRHATVLAVHPSARGPDGKPLTVIATIDAGTGRCMVVTADTTYRWYLPNRALGRESPYVRFWGQAVRWLAGEQVKREEKPGLDAFLNKAKYELHEDVHLLAYAYDPQGQATSEATVHVSVIDPSSRRTKLTLRPVEGSPGEYRWQFRPTSPGRHEAVFRAYLGAEPLGESQTIPFSVAAPNREMEDLALRADVLKKIAAATGGRYHSWFGLNELAESLAAEQVRKHEPVMVKLYHGPAFLIFFILVAAGEWYLRKRIQLA
ncbi:MAG: hypothetical protein ACLF0G_05670 [Candidatus Brocadiia bacterium]